MAAPRGFSVVVAFLAALALQRAASLPVALEADRLLASAEVAPAGSAAVPRAGLSLFGSGCKSEHLQNLTLGHLINLHFHDDGDRSSKADVPSEIRGDPEGVELTTTTLTITKPKSGAEATGVAKKPSWRSGSADRRAHFEFRCGCHDDSDYALRKKMGATDI
mmetsp:Transcript_69560/g.126878  ORF Transcript_69560/g.126878 Transcript_69560/m.126878 type:complete len:163 (-) Transcript_69560:1980-2468(-)